MQVFTARIYDKFVVSDPGHNNIQEQTTTTVEATTTTEEATTSTTEPQTCPPDGPRTQVIGPDGTVYYYDQAGNLCEVLAPNNNQPFVQTTTSQTPTTKAEELAITGLKTGDELLGIVGSASLLLGTLAVLASRRRIRRIHQNS